MAASHFRDTSSSRLKAVRELRWGAATFAAVAASAAAVVPPVVMKALNPGRGIAVPLGMMSRISSSVTCSMPIPVCGRGISSSRHL